MNSPILPRQFDGSRPNRLWSLWDIMEKLDASALQCALSKLRREQTTIERGPPEHKAERLSEKSRTAYRRHLTALLEQIGKLGGVIGSPTAVQRLLRNIEGQKFTYGAFDEAWRNFEGLLQDELNHSFLFALNLKEVGYFTRPREGWEEIIGRFGGTVGDIEEARKCFALSRYSASVFHSLQIVEIGLIELGKEIGVNDPHSGWTAVTNKLAAIQKAKHSERTELERKHWPFLEQIAATIEALKNAWRNKVSHAHGKLVLMTADFSPEVAEEILMATRAFMRRLATDGPLASPEQSS